MSTTLSLVEPAASMSFRSVEIAERRENHDAWELADAIYEDVLSLVPSVEVATSTSQGPDKGLEVATDSVYDAHRKAGTEIGRTYVRQMFATVRVWPPEQRLPDKASFVVHSELRGKDYPNRREIIERLAARSKTGRVSWSDLRRWKSERKPAAVKTFRQLFEERVRHAALQAGKPWNAVAEDDRAALAAICRAIADEIETGTFGVQS